MKTIMTSMLSVAVAAFVLGATASAADKEAPKDVKAKVVTMTGTATCANCDLGTDEACASVFQVKDGEKTVTYYLAGKADKAWHKKSKICKAPKEATLTGTVSEKDGKKTLAVTKIDKIAT